MTKATAPDSKPHHISRVLFSIVLTVVVVLGGYLAIHWLAHIKV